ncbi:MAG: hypothetical protein WKF30_11600, partial [Pyrinomonadaceae bacterium]
RPAPRRRRAASVGARLMVSSSLIFSGIVTVGEDLHFPGSCYIMAREQIRALDIEMSVLWRRRPQRTDGYSTSR